MPKKLITLLLILTTLFCCSKENKISHVTPQRVDFMVYILSQYTVFEIYNDEYLDILPITFGVTEDDVENMVDYIQKTNSIKKLEENVHSALSEEITALVSDSSTIDNFMYNVLTPYLWYVRLHKKISSSDINAINDYYMKTFKPADGINHLQSFVNNFNSYEAGGYFKIDSLNMFNQSIQSSNYYLHFDVDNIFVCLFGIEKSLLDTEISSKYGISVYLLQRKIPSILPSANGLSYLGAKDVIVFKDKLELLADEIRENLNSKYFLEYKDEEYRNVWSRFGLNMDLGHANELIEYLIKRDFEAKSRELITKDLIYSVAIHEAKHKYDDNTQFIRINWDSEISAHLTQVYVSNTPFYDLTSAINRIEGFTSISYEKKMVTVAHDLWKLAEKVKTDSLTADQLRNEVYTIYEAYRTEDNLPLPTMDNFKKDFVPSLYSGVYGEDSRIK